METERETMELSATELRQRMAARGITQGDLAIAAGLHEPTVSAILNGRILVGERRLAKLERGILRLRLDIAHCKEPVKPETPIFRIRRI